MTRWGYELWLALVTILFSGMAYLFVAVVQGGIPDRAQTSARRWASWVSR